MMSPMFESLVVNSLTILADEPDDATAMVWNEAETQAEFRRYFGKHNSEMPTKSVAHQIYYEVFPKERRG